MNYRNAKYINETADVIDCEVEHPVHGWIPFTAATGDTGSDIDVDSLILKIKSEGLVEAYTPPTQEELNAKYTLEARSHRAHLLSAVDDLATNPLRWGDLSAAQKEEVAVYRRHLLDVTDQVGFPHTIDWATPPSFL